MPEPISNSILETGTTTVVLTSADGGLRRADRRASLGGRFVFNKRMQKIEQVHPTAAMTLAGAVGGLQSFVRTLRPETERHETRRGTDMDMAALAVFGE